MTTTTTTTAPAGVTTTTTTPAGAAGPAGPAARIDVSMTTPGGGDSELTMDAAARLTGRHPEYLRTWIRRGVLPARKVPTGGPRGTWLVRLSDLARVSGEHPRQVQRGSIVVWTRDPDGRRVGTRAPDSGRLITIRPGPRTELHRVTGAAMRAGATTPRELAAALGITPRVAEVRLRRARREGWDEDDE